IIRPPFNVGRLSEYAALAALEDQEYLVSIREYNAQERAKFFELTVSDRFYPSQTNFVYINTDKPHDLYEAFLNVGCITREFPKEVRVTIGFPEQNDKMIEVLKSFEF
ncbi:histidinol-phosphate aminotransferase, partial [Mammaliicoccus fleurettii]